MLAEQVHYIYAQEKKARVKGDHKLDTLRVMNDPDRCLRLGLCAERASRLLEK